MNLELELEETRMRLAEAEQTLEAIRNGEVDGLVMTGEHPLQIFTLQGSQEPYRLLIERMSEGAFTLSREGDILYANEALARMLHVPLEQLIGSEFRRYVIPADRAVFSELMATAWNGSSHGEVAAELKGGIQIPLRLSINRVEFPPEVVLGVIATDLTSAYRSAELERRVAERTEELYVANRTLIREGAERKRAEEMNRQYAAIVAFSDDSIISKTLDGVITSWNPAAERLFGYSAEEMLGGRLDRLYPPDRKGEEAEMLARIQRGERVEHFETVRVAKQGNQIHVSVTISPIRDTRGRIVGVSKIARDITEQKRLTEEIKNLNSELEQRVKERTSELLAANKELEAFSYTVSHDLRAPLRAIDGYSQILTEDYAARLDEEGCRLLGVIRSEAQRMGRLIDELLNFSRIGRHSMDRCMIDMEGIAKESFQQAIRIETGRTIHLKIEPLPQAFGEPTMLRQVWANLLSNAVKFTRHNDEANIEIGSKRENGETIYYVRDNGAGFDMAHADKLFGVFQRLHQEEEFEGTGVGLAFVKRILQRHNGRIWAEAVVGQGATFYFTLPDRSDHESPRKATL